MNDLFVICPDLDWESVLQEIFARPEALGTRRFVSKVKKFAGQKDGGVRKKAVDLVRSVLPLADCILVIFDRDGCGDRRPAEMIEEELNGSLAHTVAGSGKAARALVVEPELETWLIGAFAHFAIPNTRAAGANAREWLARNRNPDNGTLFWPVNTDKPDDPKRAVHAFFRAHQVKVSSAAYRKVAARASLDIERCSCRSFHRFVKLLRAWFPA